MREKKTQVLLEINNLEVKAQFDDTINILHRDLQNILNTKL